ncbi:hypothetical protein MW887_007220 [Aspergillus wentii]|nr:hypothetical protein MW887_007220 [Aspergillus wentii]
MRLFTPHILSLFGAVTATFAANTGKSNSDAVPLTRETFYDFMEKHELVLANFYAPWCRYSRALAPKFEQAATALKHDNIPLVKVNCDYEDELCSDIGIGWYPTLKVFRGPESHEPYDGNQEADSYATHQLK